MISIHLIKQISICDMWLLCVTCLFFLVRKGTLLFNNIFSIVPAIMMGLSEVANSYEMIIVARFLVGICAGLFDSDEHVAELSVGS